MRMRRAGLLAVATGMALAATLTGCGQQEPTSTTSGPVGASGGKEIVVFVPSSTNRYIQQWESGARTKADQLGYKLTILESPDKDDQSAKIDQQLTKPKPAGFIYWPTANEALVGKQAQLAAAAPLIMTNQLPLPDSSYTAYAGVNDILNGQYAGEMLQAACAKAAKPCKDGIIVRFPTGYSAGDDRIAGFKKAVGDLNVLQVVDSGGFQETEGYTTSKSVVSADKSKLTWVYANNDAIAAGVIKALQETGLKPGEDVLVVGGTCHGDSAHLLNGDLVGTAIQPAFLEGWLAVQTLHKYLKSGKVIDGDINVDPSPDTPPSDDGAPHKRNFMPNPKVEPSAAAYETAKVWGYDMKQLCDY